MIALLFLSRRNGKLLELYPGRGIKSVHYVSSPSGQSILISVLFSLSTMPTQGTPQHPTANLFGATSCTYVIKWSVRKNSYALVNFLYLVS